MTDPEAETAAGEVFDTASPREMRPKNPPNRGGRPPHQPTERARRTVETYAAALIPHATIASLVGVSSVNTLKRHYPEELRVAGPRRASGSPRGSKSWWRPAAWRRSSTSPRSS